MKRKKSKTWMVKRKKEEMKIGWRRIIEGMSDRKGNKRGGGEKAERTTMNKKKNIYSLEKRNFLHKRKRKKCKKYLKNEEKNGVF